MYTKKDWKCCDEFDNTTEDVIMDNGKHYAKQVCAHCKHYIKWLPNPNITKETEDRNKKIDITISNPKITPKMKEFMISIKTKRFLTPKQLNYFLGICEKYTPK